MSPSGGQLALMQKVTMPVHVELVAENLMKDHVPRSFNRLTVFFLLLPFSKPRYCDPVVHPLIDDPLFHTSYPKRFLSRASAMHFLRPAPSSPPPRVHHAKLSPSCPPVSPRPPSIEHGATVLPATRKPRAPWQTSPTAPRGGTRH